MGFLNGSSEAVVNNPFFPSTNYPQTLKQAWRLLTYTIHTVIRVKTAGFEAQIEPFFASIIPE